MCYSVNGGDKMKAWTDVNLTGAEKGIRRRMLLSSDISLKTFSCYYTEKGVTFFQWYDKPFINTCIINTMPARFYSFSKSHIFM